jgi:phosphatidylinositol alpha-1,6-mannosyltransferase
VFFLGHVEAVDLPRWYNACDLFVMPNREIDGDTEGFGLVFLEAAACGKTSIAGMAGGTGSAVLNGETGMRVEGNSIEQVSQCLDKLLTENEWREQLGVRAMKRAKEEFSWEAVTGHTELKLGI